MKEYKEYFKHYMVKTFDDRVEWRNDGALDRINGPAIEYFDGRKYWYSEGLLHREDGPAIDEMGNQEWYIKGERHREDGPAVVRGDYKEYWLNGVEVSSELFEKERPLESQKIIDSDFVTVWYKADGVTLHREDGPAIMYKKMDGSPDHCEYYIDGNFMYKEDFDKRKGK